MTGKIFKSLVVAVSVTAILSFDLPKGWYKSGSAPEKYEMGVEFGSGRASKYAATIQSNARRIHGFGTLMQNISADKYRGKKIKLSGYMKSYDVEKWAGFWLRVDAKKSKTPLSFDNMYDRPVSGNSNWQKYEIILDVPDNASNIAFGALLSGTGKIWFDDLKIEEVPGSVSSTGSKHKQRTEPENLDFEE